MFIQLILECEYFNTLVYKIVHVTCTFFTQSCENPTAHIKLLPASCSVPSIVEVSVIFHYRRARQLSKNVPDCIPRDFMKRLQKIIAS